MEVSDCVFSGGIGTHYPIVKPVTVTGVCVSVCLCVCVCVCVCFRELLAVLLANEAVQI